MTLQAKEDLTSIISRISAGDAIPPSGASLSSAPSSSPHPDPQSDALSEANRLANHLRDLAPEDLPDSQRAVTMSSIAAFRERAAKKQNEKRELDRQIEERRQSMMQNRRNQHNHYGQPQQQPSNGPGNSYQQGQQQVDPQSFNQNVAFVKENQQNQPEPEVDDAKRERERAEMEHRQQEQMFREVSNHLFSTLCFALTLKLIVTEIRRRREGLNREREGEYKLGRGRRSGSEASLNRKIGREPSWPRGWRLGMMIEKQRGVGNLSISIGTLSTVSSSHFCPSS